MLAVQAMRTRFEIVLADDRDPGALRAAGEEALEEIVRVERELSAFAPGSALAQLNAWAADRPVAVDGLMLAFLRQTAALSETLEGAFDPTVGALTALYRSNANDDALADARRLVGFPRVVRIDEESATVSFAQQGVALDPGAIGKGWALDRAAQVLCDAGVHAALLHGGTSSVLAMGAPAGCEGWTVAVQDPLVPEGRLARVTLRDAALGVSAIYGRSYRRGDTRVGHVLDPRSGQPVDHTVLAAVVTRSATEADAASTALLVLGEAAIARLGARLPGASFLAARLHQEALHLTATGALAATA